MSPALIMTAKNSDELNFILQTSYAPSFAKIRIEETSHSQIQRRWSFWNLLYLLGWFWRRGQVTDFAMRPRLSFQGNLLRGKVKKILKGSLDSISSPLPSVKIRIMGGKVCLRCKDKTLLGIVNKLLKTKSLLTSPSNVLPYYLK